MWETIFFWIFAVGAVLSSLAVVLIPRNPLYNALALIVDFFFFAGLYGLLSAHFLAVVQVLVYGGAIMVLFMFIIMLLNLRDNEQAGGIKINVHQGIGIVAACAFFGILVASFQGLSDAEKVSQARTQYEEKLEADPLYYPGLDVSSPIPGLALDINEKGINQRYTDNILAYASNRLRPSDGALIPGYNGILPKYREYDRSKPVVIPEELLPNRDSDVASRAEDDFGTIQPLSVLLVNRFVVPFELTAILLLAAVIGAFIIAKKRL